MLSRTAEAAILAVSDPAETERFLADCGFVRHRRHWAIPGSHGPAVRVAHATAGPDDRLRSPGPRALRLDTGDIEATASRLSAGGWRVGEPMVVDIDRPTRTRMAASIIEVEGPAGCRVVVIGATGGSSPRLRSHSLVWAVGHRPAEIARWEAAGLTVDDEFDVRIDTSTTNAAPADTQAAETAPVPATVLRDIARPGFTLTLIDADDASANTRDTSDGGNDSRDPGHNPNHDLDDDHVIDLRPSTPHVVPSGWWGLAIDVPDPVATAHRLNDGSFGLPLAPTAVPALVGGPSDYGMSIGYLSFGGVRLLFTESDRPAHLDDSDRPVRPTSRR